MNRRILVVVIGLLALVPFMNVSREVLLAGASMEHVFSDEVLLPTYPIVARIVVTAISDPDAHSKGNPPKLKVRVVAYIRGDAAATEIDARWRPMPHDIDYEGGDSEERLAAWNNEPYPPPEVDSEWIVCGEIREQALWIAPRCRYEYSEEKLAWVRNTLVDGLAALERQRLETELQAALVRAEDLSVQLTADLTEMFREATDVVIAERSSEASSSPNRYVVTLRVHERIKDSRESQDEREAFLFVLVHDDAKVMVQRRMYTEDHRYQKVIVFLRAIPPTDGVPPPETSSVSDKRLFEFVDYNNGMIPWTQRREDALKCIQKAG